MSLRSDHRLHCATVNSIGFITEKKSSQNAYQTRKRMKVNLIAYSAYTTVSQLQLAEKICYVIDAERNLSCNWFKTMSTILHVQVAAYLFRSLLLTLRWNILFFAIYSFWTYLPTHIKSCCNKTPFIRILLVFLISFSSIASHCVRNMQCDSYSDISNFLLVIINASQIYCQWN